jgi:hypothetical protein
VRADSQELGPIPAKEGETVDFLTFPGCGFRWGIPCSEVVCITSPAEGAVLRRVEIPVEFRPGPRSETSSDALMRALWVHTPSGERSLLVSDRPEMVRIPSASIKPLPALCAPNRVLGLRVTAVVLRDEEVLFLVVEPAA